MPIKKLDYSHAYGFADTVVNAIDNPESYDLTEYILPDFFDFKSEYFYLAVSKPQKKTLLHIFIKNVNFSGIEWATGKLDGHGIVEEFGGMLDASGIARPEWFNENNVLDYISECDQLLECVSEIITESTFQLLFSDRNLLFKFSKMIGKYIQTLSPSDNHVVKKQAF